MTSSLPFLLVFCSCISSPNLLLPLLWKTFPSLVSTCVEWLCHEPIHPSPSQQGCVQSSNCIIWVGGNRDRLPSISPVCTVMHILAHGMTSEALWAGLYTLSGCGITPAGPPPPWHESPPLLDPTQLITQCRLALSVTPSLMRHHRCMNFSYPLVRGALCWCDPGLPGFVWIYQC